MLIKLAGPGAVVSGAANDYELASLAEVKAYLDIPSGNTGNDTQLQTLMDVVHQQVFRFLGSRFIRLNATAFDLVMDGPGDGAIYLPQYPVSTITTVEIGYMPTGTTFSSQHTWSATGYAVAGEQRDSIQSLDWYGFPEGKLNVHLVFTAGYSLANIPPDIKAACAELVGIAQNRAKTKRWDVSNISKQQSSESYITEWAPNSVLQKLAPHRRTEAFIG